MAHVDLMLHKAETVEVTPHLSSESRSGPFATVYLGEEDVTIFVTVSGLGNTRQLIAALQDACDRVQSAHRKPDPLQIPMPLNADDMRPTTWGGPEGM